MSSEENIQKFYEGNVPLCLKKPDAKAVVKKYFIDIENAAEKGQTGAVLCFMSLFYTEKDCWQHSFSHGFFKYCQKNGYGNFANTCFIIRMIFQGTAKICTANLRFGKDNV